MKALVKSLCDFVLALPGTWKNFSLDVYLFHNISIGAHSYSKDTSPPTMFYDPIEL